MLITEFLDLLESVVPLASKGYERDSVGLQISPSALDAKLTHALFAYEVTGEVVEEAHRRSANLIVAFHPLIFGGLAAITERDRTGVLVRELIRNNIALYVLHTAFDSSTEFGTSQLMAEVLELEDIRPLEPLKNTQNKISVFLPYSEAQIVSSAMSAAGAGRIGDAEACSFQVEGRGRFLSSEYESEEGEKQVIESVDQVRLEMVCETWNTMAALKALKKAASSQSMTYEVTPILTEDRNYGMGAIGGLSKPKNLEELLHSVRDAFSTDVLRYNSLARTSFSQIAVLGGAGMDYYPKARSAGAQVFITSDVRYHDFYRAQHDNILLIDAGHAETEQFVARGMARAARSAFERLTRKNVFTSSDSEMDELILIAEAKPNAVSYFITAPKKHNT